MSYEETTSQHYFSMLDGAGRRAINDVIDKVIELEKENAKLKDTINRLAKPFFPEEGATIQDENTRLRAENYRLNQLLNGNNARRSMEEHISNEIVDGTYDPCPTDFDYETPLHEKLTKVVKERDFWKKQHESLRDECASSIQRLQKALGGCSLTPYQAEADLEIEAAIKALKKIEYNVKELGLSEWYVSIRHADKGEVLLKGWCNDHFPSLLDSTIKKYKKDE